MEIGSSTLATGLAGVQRSQEAIQRNAEDIVRVATAENEGGAAQDTSAVPSEGGQGAVSSDQRVPDLAQSLVELRANQRLYEASAGVVQTADEALGTLIDTSA